MSGERTGIPPVVVFAVAAFALMWIVIAGFCGVRWKREEARADRLSRQAVDLHAEVAQAQRAEEVAFEEMADLTRQRDRWKARRERAVTATKEATARVRACLAACPPHDGEP